MLSWRWNSGMELGVNLNLKSQKLPWTEFKLSSKFPLSVRRFAAAKHNFNHYFRSLCFRFCRHCLEFELFCVQNNKRSYATVCVCLYVIVFPYFTACLDQMTYSFVQMQYLFHCLNEFDAGLDKTQKKGKNKILRRMFHQGNGQIFRDSLKQQKYVSIFSVFPLAETAVNIGYSCKMLTDDMTEVFIINGHTVQSVRQELRSVYFIADLPKPLVFFQHTRTSKDVHLDKKKFPKHAWLEFQLLQRDQKKLWSVTDSARLKQMCDVQWYTSAIRDRIKKNVVQEIKFLDFYRINLCISAKMRYL